MSNDPFADMLGIESNIAPKPDNTFIPPQDNNEEIVLDEGDFSENLENKMIVTTPDEAEDYKESRKTFKKILKIGIDAMDELAELAETTEQPRAYEVLAQLMKQTSESTKDLYDLQFKKKEYIYGKNNINNTLNHNNYQVDKAVFVGSTADLLEKLDLEDEALKLENKSVEEK